MMLVFLQACVGLRQGLQNLLLSGSMCCKSARIGHVLVHVLLCAHDLQICTAPALTHYLGLLLDSHTGFSVFISLTFIF